MQIECTGSQPTQARRSVPSNRASARPGVGMGSAILSEVSNFFEKNKVILTNWYVKVAILLEQRYKGIRSPHKFKGGVSGCVRECAEAQGKDFGLIATDKGWNSTL